MAVPSGSLAQIDAASAPDTIRLLVQLSPNPDDASGHRQLTREQELLTASLATTLPTAVVERAYRLVWHGLALRIPADQAAQARETLAGLDMVGGVFDDIPFYPASGVFDTPSPPSEGPRASASLLHQVSLVDLWEEETSVRVAILDSGIAIGHTMLDSAGLNYPPGYPKGQAIHTTPKVIAARVYVRATDPPLPGEGTPVPGPLGSPQGTHLASIVAGRSVIARIRALDVPLAGIDPSVRLMNYRLFYPSVNSVNGAVVAYSAEIIQAIEDAVADGADILLTGWASAAERLPVASPVSQALDRAMDAGCIVIAPAGDDGPATGSASRLPGGMERVITVGAISQAQIVAPDVVDVVGAANIPPELTGAPFSRALFGAAVPGAVPGEPISVIGPFPYRDVGNYGDPYGCNPLPPGVMQNRIALVRRGQCPFADKAYYAQQAGAIGVIIYNELSDQELEEIACAGAYCAPGVITIPVVMVSHAFGVSAIDWQRAHPDAALRIDPRGRLIHQQPGQVWAQSGRGPAFMRHIKPDVVAPGIAILGAVPGVGYGNSSPRSSPERDLWEGAVYDAAYTMLTGTGQAAAHVAGVAALLQRQHPTWSSAQIKAALLGTATSEGLTVPGDGAAGVFAYGAGKVRADLAADPVLLATPATLSIAVGPAPTTTAILLTAPPTAGRARTYTVSVVPVQGLEIDVRAQITLSPGEERFLDLKAALTAGALPPRQPQATTLVLTASDRTLLVPILLSVMPDHADALHPTPAQVLLIDNDFSFFGLNRDYRPYVVSALNEIGLGHVVHEADAFFDRPQTIPDLDVLLRYPLIIWLTGDNPHPDGYFTVSTPLTALDQQLLMSYLDGGGRLLAIGPNLALASDVNPQPDPIFGRSKLFHAYLGAHWLPDGRGQVRGATGVPGTWLAPPSSVAYNACFSPPAPREVAGQIGAGGLPDSSDADLVQGVMAFYGGTSQPLGTSDIGYAAVSKADRPTLETANAPAPQIPYRTIHLAFHPDLDQTSSGCTSLANLLRRAYNWLMDKVTVALPIVGTHEQLPIAAFGAPGAPTSITATATTSRGSAVTGFRWALGASPPFEDSQQSLIEKQKSRLEPLGEGEVKGTISPVYPTAGQYPIVVEASDDLGHTAIAQGTVLVVPGGATEFGVSAAQAHVGDNATLIYRLMIRHIGHTPAYPTTLPMQVSVALPANTEYISHIGGDVVAGVWSWSGNLAHNTAFGAELTVRVADTVRAGDDILAIAHLSVGAGPDASWQRTARTRIIASHFFPLLFRP
jgi:hypothetical protein